MGGVLEIYFILDYTFEYRYALYSNINIIRYTAWNKE